jgi:hypothetical protein
MLMYLRRSTLIQKQVFGKNLSLAVDMIFLVLMFHIFKDILLLKIKTLSLHIFIES